VNSSKNKKAGLSFTEQHEFKNIENKIADLEAQLAAIHVEFEKPENLSQPKVCEELSIKMSQIQKQVDQTYERWQFLEAKAKV
jgi:ATP-binding cassette subfamily F protein uup